MPRFDHASPPRPGGLLLLVALSGLVTAPLAAQEEAQPAPEPSGFLAEFLALDQQQAEKLVGLATAIPAEKYDWRPAAGVRSVAGIFMHVAQTNFLAVQAVTGGLPEDLPQDFSALTEKERVVELLERSFELVRQTARAMAALDLNQPAVQGTTVTTRAAILNHAAHQGEHLGQAIAYARSVGVVPPWSQ